MRLELGSPVNCTDGLFGKLTDVVIDPTKRRVTHLVVEPDGDHGKARLVPVELAEEDGSSAISLRCSLEEARKFKLVEEYAYIRLGESPDLEPGWDIGVENVLAEPYYSYGAGIGVGAGYEALPAEYDPHVSMTFDRIPKGEVEIRRASDVTSTDGHHLGKVDGFLVDDDDAITHFVLERGHLWGKKEVTIPFKAVASVSTDAVSLSLTKDEVGELPSVPVHRWGG